MIACRPIVFCLQSLLLLSVCLVILGCSNEREDEFVERWITCARSETGKWVSSGKALFGRFNIVHELRYRVSFSSQHVVSSTGTKLRECTVYDRNNWTCIDTDGSRLRVQDGKKFPAVSCDPATGKCILQVNLLNRVLILVLGILEADRLCDASASEMAVELHHRLTGIGKGMPPGESDADEQLRRECLERAEQILKRALERDADEQLLRERLQQEEGGR